MERENFFILLELPFEPPVDDKARIKAAINIKQQEWARLHDQQDMRSTALAYLELIPEMEEVMLNAESRRKEAQKAQKIKGKMIAPFVAELRLLENKGYIFPREVKELGDKYSRFGIDKKMLDSHIAVPITDTAPKAKQEFKTDKALDIETVRSIKGHLEVLEKEDLYDFLKLKKPTELKRLETAARKIHQDAFHSEEKTGSIIATQLLSEIAVDIFSDAEKRAEYDKYLEVSEHPELNELIQEEYDRSGYISPDILIRLVNFGVTTYDENVLNVEEYIREYCRAYDITVDIQAPEVSCPNCGKDTPRGQAFCQHCAAPLEGNCPQCDTFFSGGAKVCSNCGFAVGNMGKALPYAEQVENSLNDNNWSSAKHGLNYIEQYWPLYPRYEELKKRADLLEQKYYQTLALIEEAIKEKRFYAARELLERSQAENIKVPEDISGYINEILQEFSETLKALKEEQDIGYDSLHNLLNSVSDSLELDRMLSKYPPEPPVRITARAEGDKVHINWSKSESSGILEYVLVRKEDSVSLTAYDGDILYQGEENGFEDLHIPPLRNFFYSVYVKRGTSFSEMGAVAAAPVRIVPELQDFKVIPADTAAQLSWTPPKHLNSVKIWRKQGGEQPDAPGDGVLLETDRLDGFSDLELQNDVSYWYYAVASYRTSEGETVDSSGIVDSVVPHKLIAPIDQFVVAEVENEQDVYLANWEGAPRNEILLFSSPTRPQEYLGQVVKTDELMYRYNRLQLDNQTENNAKFRLSVDGGQYIIPVAVAGPFGTMGQPFYLTDVPNVADISYSITDSDLFLEFDWPQEYSRSVVVAWRKDEYPSSISQKNTEYIECNKEQYDSDHGVRIGEITPGNYYIKIYTTFVSPEDKVIYSTGKEFFVDNTPPVEIFYDIKYTKKLFASLDQLSITIRTETEFDLPRAVVVAKKGQLPVDITDGIQLFKLRPEKNVSRAIKYEYKTERLPKNIFMRLFFYDESDYRRIRPLPAKSLIIT